MGPPRPLPRVHLATLALPLLLAAACQAGEEGPGSSGDVPEAAAAGMVVSGGFATPESVLHDDVADVYLVTNISGAPLDRDDDGFISRVSPDGEILELRWIDGNDEETELHAPKGMALRGDTLYVADIDCVRMFSRTGGEPAGEVCFPEATFLNDVAVDRNGTLYVTDSGLTAAFESSGTDAVYRFDPAGRQAKLSEGEGMGRPNGIAFGSRGGFVVTFGTGEIYQIGPDGSRTPVMPPSDRQLDGIVFTPDGGFLFSSWGDQAVYRVAPTGEVTPVVEGVEAPADIGWDAERGRVLIPLFNGDEIRIVDVPGATASGGGTTGEDGGG